MMIGLPPTSSPLPALFSLGAAATHAAGAPLALLSLRLSLRFFVIGA